MHKGTRRQRLPRVLPVVTACMLCLSAMLLLTGCPKPKTVQPLEIPAPMEVVPMGEVEKPKSAFSDLLERDEDSAQDLDMDEPDVKNNEQDLQPVAGQIDGLDAEPWGQIVPIVESRIRERSAERYIEVIEQFDMMNHCRYYNPDQDSAPAKCKGQSPKVTRCNIFAGDVMRAMGIPLPTKGDLGVGHGEAKTTDLMTANAKHLNLWLNNQMGDGGSSAGWRAIDPTNPADLELLRNHLASGKPALASDPGHIAVLRPDGLPAQITQANLGGLHVAQAGATLSENVPMSSVGYGTGFNPTIFIHE